MFQKRSEKLERIDTGDYTPKEYERFLREIRFINRYVGDARALRKSLLRDIEKENQHDFSVLDVGAGSGELLRVIADFASRRNIKSRLVGLELNAVSAKSILLESEKHPEITAVRADAFLLPFGDKSFDYAICSLFTHHFTNENVVLILREFDRVARRKVFVIDLHRQRMGYVLYRIFCAAFRISPLVREDGSLSILRSFVPEELKSLAKQANLKDASIRKVCPSRLVLEIEKKQ